MGCLFEILRKSAIFIQIFHSWWLRSLPLVSPKSPFKKIDLDVNFLKIYFRVTPGRRQRLRNATRYICSRRLHRRLQSLVIIMQISHIFIDVFTNKFTDFKTKIQTLRTNFRFWRQITERLCRDWTTLLGPYFRRSFLTRLRNGKKWKIIFRNRNV